ncbi:hypothetical protein OU415_08335 [Saccharopolyspora sp. WRP15-2]|uniref:Uncharacterized protein n=1 Tax=Saccharopolyspora oryzae TaxID=2997343 RepID=A0ABT4UW51_9PSEU|nr:hypothetical protein [Saccharopolyspora oryzae]MDA3625441.1 hypothetical protein [Saccharopolyspora oryzae]
MAIDHALAGYRVASRAARQDWQDVGLPSADLVSMSSCVVDVLESDPDGWDGWFDDLRSAERARAQESRELHVLEVGFAVPDLPELSADIADGGWDAAAGSLPERLARGEPCSGGRLLGFELVGYDCGLWHTWTCLGGLVRDVGRATGVRPGQWGLIQDEQQARQAADWLTESGLGDPKVFRWVAARLVAAGG